MTSHETMSNRPVEVTSNRTSARTFSHDAVGNLVTDNRSGTAYTYRYNNRGRLDELSTGSTVTADYSYDGLDRMAIRTVRTASPPVTMHYVYDLAGHLIAEATLPAASPANMSGSTTCRSRWRPISTPPRLNAKTDVGRYLTTGGSLR